MKKIVVGAKCGAEVGGIPAGEQLLNPKITLYSGGTPIATNTGWMTDSQQAQLAPLMREPTQPASCALYRLLSPGPYTVVVEGTPTGATGISLFEVYDSD